MLTPTKIGSARADWRIIADLRCFRVLPGLSLAAAVRRLSKRDASPAERKAIESSLRNLGFDRGHIWIDPQASAVPGVNGLISFRRHESADPVATMARRIGYPPDTIESQREIETFLLFGENSTKRAMLEGQLVEQVGRLIQAEGLTVFETWLRFDWMLKPDEKTAKIYEGTHWDVYRANDTARYILVIKTHKVTFLFDHDISMHIRSMFAEEVRKNNYFSAVRAGRLAADNRSPFGLPFALWEISYAELARVSEGERQTRYEAEIAPFFESTWWTKGIGALEQRYRGKNSDLKKKVAKALLASFLPIAATDAWRSYGLEHNLCRLVVSFGLGKDREPLQRVLAKLS